MIWLTWRQLRGSAAMMAALLVLLAVVLAVTGPDLASRYAAGIAACTQDDTCGRFYDRFFSGHEFSFMALSLVVLVLPALVGLFWGAPLITRELEAGTHLLVWNQSVTRRRWLAVKLALPGLVAVAAAGLCGLAVTWWSGPLDKSASENLALMAPLVFGARHRPDGVRRLRLRPRRDQGMVVRHTLPAMALTLAVFAAVQLAMPLLVRPHLMPAVTSTFELGQANMEGIGINQDRGGVVEIHLRSAVPGHGGAWVLSGSLVDPAGRTLGDGAEVTVPISTTSGPCAPSGSPVMDACAAEINRLGYRQKATYQPLERFWPFQWIETGIYAFLTLGLTWLSFWWIRRRLS
ncbi:ABC transporter permease [Nonomuraea rhodomycinica]|uniref:ABC transporter permease n=1 Tax=Nonomuraea rhodomycinica TaxID=1712872 RepID=UPI001FE7321D|nr:ABC transporter permease [Nonomuraea rhodomycinica]